MAVFFTVLSFMDGNPKKFFSPDSEYFLKELIRIFSVCCTADADRLRLFPPKKTP
jgi:hypothetical protein